MATQRHRAPQDDKLRSTLTRDVPGGLDASETSALLDAIFASADDWAAASGVKTPLLFGCIDGAGQLGPLKAMPGNMQIERGMQFFPWSKVGEPLVGASAHKPPYPPP